ncbi:hypothetical protein [Pseudarthrobacter sp. PS3-L1]|uniref:hypothetical protein n=1 Tax=Pseudarthrobacter sp. PS3-L1 TaxID=3046207 RepID=UPI0024BBD063|nr:hypothetical protein [Pseudarthrobacter sp. PS3-L1]MDJ0321824.1 hypothetical protein [Pseudarthrobacter sp. PS3-L1]
MPEIQWAGRTLSGSDRHGVWTSEVPDGWWDSPDTKGEIVSRTNKDGDYILPIYNQARLVTFNGLLRAKSHEKLHQAGIFLTGAMTGRAQVTDHGPTQWADAVRAGKIRFTPITDTLASWQVPLRCPDPRKYGEESKFTIPSLVSVTAYHRGNAPAYPSFVVAGSMPGGYTLTVGGSQFKVTEPLISGVSHGITFADGRLRIRGAVVHGGVGTAETPGIAAGTMPTVYLEPAAGSTGTATAFMTLTDTYI